MNNTAFESVTIGEVCSLITDGSHFSPTPREDGFPIVNAKDIPNGRIELATCTRISKRDFRLLKNQNCAPIPGDVLLSKDGTIGRVVHYNEDLAVVLLSSVAILRPKTFINAAFLAHTLRSHFFEQQLFCLQSGSALKRLILGDIRKIRVPIVKLETQNAIAEILSTVDEAIEQTEALIHKYQHIKAGLMHDLFTRGVTPDGRLRPTHAQAPHLYKHSPLGWIPKEWDVGCIEELCSDVVDCPHSTPTYVPRGVPCIRTADMQSGALLLDQAYCVTQAEYLERVARLVPQEGDIIYSREGERLGIASPVGCEKVCLGQRVMLMRPACETNSDFLLWAMNTPSFYRRIISGLGATTSPHVNVGDIRKALLVQPSSAEQELIGNSLASHTSLVRAEETQLAKLRQQKHGLMHDLLTGRVRVKVGHT